jgi:hypothetical protein
MATMRCPKHDHVFETTTDSRAPNSGAKDHLPAHPLGGHPDCELCQKEKKSAVAVAPGGARRIA